MKTIVPIFFAKTRSFWLAIVPAALTMIDTLFQMLTSDQAGPVADALALILSVFGADWTGDQIAAAMRGVAPIYLLIFAQQRGAFSGAIPRPYTLDPEKEKAIARTVENGKDVFDAGYRMGAQIKDALRK